MITWKELKIKWKFLRLRSKIIGLRSPFSINDQANFNLALLRLKEVYECKDPFTRYCHYITLFGTKEEIKEMYISMREYDSTIDLIHKSFEDISYKHTTEDKIQKLVDFAVKHQESLLYGKKNPNTFENSIWWITDIWHKLLIVEKRVQEAVTMEREVEEFGRMQKGNNKGNEER